jgi:hypothetical protein
MLVIIKSMERNIYKIEKELFITSKEEIKEGDSVILKSGRLTKAEIKEGALGFQTIDGIAFLPFQKGDEKVILTTDQDLITDGVQAIDDEFLEWFVNNPSCEWVHLGFMSNITSNGSIKEYKIIIPKEEPKQKIPNFGTSEFVSMCESIFSGKPKQETERGYTIKRGDGSVIKQETLEEAAERLYPGIDRQVDRRLFINGAKYQAERMYSKEDMEEAFENGLKRSFDSDFDRWFEQFKKK